MAKQKYGSIDDYLQQTTHQLQETVTALRALIAAANMDLAEQIKWNSPAWYYTGAIKDFDPKTYQRDVLVLNLNKPDFILLIFPTGATVPEAPVLEAENLKDGRKMVKLTGLEDLAAKRAGILAVMLALSDQTE